MDLIIFLLIGHYIGDYGLQTDRMAREKGDSPTTLTFHVFVYTLTIILSTALYAVLEGFNPVPPTWLFITLAIILFITHWAQDYVKSRVNGSQQLYYVDQSLHILLLIIFRYILIKS